MTRLKKASLAALAAAITLTFGSSYIERIGPEVAAYGNLCGPSASELCYEPVLKGGFPVAYLFDAPGISVEHQLAFVEDDLAIGALLVDIAFYFGLCLLAFRLRPRQIP